MRSVLRWQVSVDDQPHRIGGGPVVLVDVAPNQADRTQTVSVWTIDEQPTPATSRTVRVYSTGQPVRDDAVPVGSVVAPPYVWHVFEVPA